MNNVNKTLYIPLYGKAYVSKKNIILKDRRAEEIWEQESFELKGKSKSKWLAYYLAMRSAIYDEWVAQEIRKNPGAVVMHIGCGMDSRVERVNAKEIKWYDIDFPEVIEERKKYYKESELYHMVSADMRTGKWKNCIEGTRTAIIIMEGVSMYFKPEELKRLLRDLTNHFKRVSVLMDCYTDFAAKATKYKNPINEVGVTEVYGVDEPYILEEDAGLSYVKEHDMTPDYLINELRGMEKAIFKKVFAGSFSKKIYRMYEYKSE